MQTEFSLSDLEQRALEQSKLAEFCDEPDMFCLKKGCQHRQIMYYLANGTMANVHLCVEDCKDLCTICTRECYSLFMLVWKQAMYEWLGFTRDILPLEATGDCNLFK